MFLRFFTHARKTRFPIFAWESLGMLGRFRSGMWRNVTLTLKVVKVIPDPLGLWANKES